MKCNFSHQFLLDCHQVLQAGLDCHLLQVDMWVFLPLKLWKSSPRITSTMSCNFLISGSPMLLVHCIRLVPSWILPKCAKTTSNLSIIPCDLIFSYPILHICGYLMTGSCKVFCVSTILSLGCVWCIAWKNALCASRSLESQLKQKPKETNVGQVTFLEDFQKV